MTGIDERQSPANGQQRQCTCEKESQQHNPEEILSIQISRSLELDLESRHLKFKTDALQI